MNYDNENFGTEQWNPLKHLIKPGNTVLIKPNLVMDVNLLPQEGVECLYTQPGVVVPVIDYVILALQGSGKIVLGDAPMQECNFNNLIQCGYNDIIQFYKSKNINIELVDFRELTTVVKNGIYYQSTNENARGQVIDLGNDSEFSTACADELKRLRVTNYDPRLMNTHHNETKHEYYISQYLLDADVVINMPKPKTHRKGGVTISLKNFVGVNVRKEFLPHHTKGVKGKSSDEYEKRSFCHALRSNLLDRKNICISQKKYFSAKVLHFLIRLCSIVLKLKRTPNSEGSWWGNDTISRTILDLNKIVLYADKNGVICEKKARNVLIVADMIISGEKEGPVLPSHKPVGYIAIGENCVAFDETISTFMGFNYKKIPTLYRARNTIGNKPLTDSDTPVVCSNEKNLHGVIGTEIPEEFRLSFIPTSGWKNHIEL